MHSRLTGDSKLLEGVNFYTSAYSDRLLPDLTLCQLGLSPGPRTLHGEAVWTRDGPMQCWTGTGCYYTTHIWATKLFCCHFISSNLPSSCIVILWVSFFSHVGAICTLTLSHSLHISLSFTITHSFSSLPLLSTPPPLPVVEVVSVMAVGRLPAAGEILINSLFICVERRAPAFWALVLWWR